MATVTTGAQDAAGNPLAASYSWIFITVPPGALDTSFGSGGRVRTGLGFDDDKALAMAIQDDGKILTAGLSTEGTSSIFTIARFQTSGALDTTFGLRENGRADYFIGEARCVGLQTDGKIVAAGTNGTDALIARYKADGTRDEKTPSEEGFNATGTATLSIVSGRNIINSLALQQNELNDEMIVVVGEAYSEGTNTQSFIARFTPEGKLDTNFGTNGIHTDIIDGTLSSSAEVVKIQSDGKIVVGGNFKDSAGTKSGYLRRYDKDGNLDQSFASNSGMVTISTGTNSILTAVVIIPVDEILVAGTKNIGAYDLFLMRYDKDGNLDSTFGTTGSVFIDDINHGVEQAADLAVQTDGKIIIGATFHPVTGTILTNDFALFRYDANGALDTTFGNGDGMTTTDFGSGYYDEISAIGLQQDGKIISVGSSWNGSDFDIGIARYWP